MELTQLSDQLSVGPQISLHDISDIADAGFRSIICNRPDFEEPNQPANHHIAEAARAIGIEFHYQPVVMGHLSGQDAQKFKEAVDKLPKPILGYCKTGMRAAALFELSGGST